MAHVLIGFAEALPAPEVVFSLFAAGHKVSAFARSNNLPLATLPLENLHVVPAPEISVSNSIDALAQLMQSDGAPDFILPMDDTALWLTSVIPRAPLIAGATGAQAHAALDKTVQVAAATAAGLAVPPTWEASALAEAASDLPYPVIAKPALAVWRRKDQLGKDDAVYLAASSATARFLESRDEQSDPYLVQPLIKGRGEGVFGFATTKGVVGWSGHRRLRMMNPHGSGSSACVSFYPEKELRGQVGVFLEQLGWVGPFMVELLRDDHGIPWFMELNGRMWGSMALARRQGLEYPAWSVALAQDAGFVPHVPEGDRKPTTQRHLGREILHLLFTMRGPKSDFHRDGWPSFWRSLSGVLKPARGAAFYNYDPDFPRYFLKDAAWTVKKALKR